MSDQATETVVFLESRLTEYLDDLCQMCAIESPTSFKPGVDILAAWVRSWSEARGWAVEAWSDPSVGDCVLVRIQGASGAGRRVLLVAHLDTVYPLGTVGVDVLSRDSDRLLGSGTADNKSGLLSSLYAMDALANLGLVDGLSEVALFCGSDEETDMRFSGPILSQIISSYDLALVMECGRENGDVVAARKGRGHFVLDIAGKSAHAGVEPHRGANAIVALSRQILTLQLLNGSRSGMTVNVGVVSGGTASNVVPDSARAEVDIRISRPEDREIVNSALESLTVTTHVPGTSCRVEGKWIAPPLPRTAEGDRLAALAQSCAHDLGFTVQAAETGGMSYANLLGVLGIPVLDGLGPIGGLDHSPDEYIRVSSIVPRTALLALLVARA